MSNTSTKTPIPLQQQSKQIYRYSLSEELNNELSRFAKNHQNDHRKEFKQAWIQWREEKDELFQIEIKKHQDFGYQGDIEDKIFKSARYYFRKKSTIAEKKAPNPDPEKDSESEAKPEKTTNKYVTVNKELLEIMDEYLKKHSQLKPAKSFMNFCNDHPETIEKEMKFLQNVKNIETEKERREKIKKTYKNRYYSGGTYVPPTTPSLLF
jgi:hypothetical protein